MINKKLLISTVLAGAALGFAMSANAAVAGPYLGVQGGWADTHWDNNTNGIGSDANSENIAGRIFTGYQFNPYFAAEIGLLWPHNATNLGVTVKELATDLNVKGIIPLAHNFNLYGKAGAAWVHANISGYGFSDSANKVYPEAGAGLSYDITPNVPLDISYTRIQSLNNNSIPSIDFIAAGIAYNFD